ncbi:MAG TPA: thermonuclease family protein [Gemmatimonadales bacterium]|nr:thermonuclease family protein [Gemmatimonadales bacterium]
MLLSLTGVAVPVHAQGPASRKAIPPRQVCVVQRISDGDTLWCRGRVKVRLLLIDAPERDQRPFGPKATAAIMRLAPVGTRLELETDVQQLDRNGRTLAYLYLPDGRMLNEELARQGFATALVYPPNVRYVERIRRAVAEARAAKRGLWASDGFACEPREHRRRKC